MNAQELPIIKSVLVSSKAIEATASDGDVAAAHAAMLSGPNATEYKAALEAQGVKTGPNWLTIIGFVGGAAAIYFIWKHYQTEKIDARDYPDPSEQRHQLRGISKALGALRLNGGSRSSCASPSRMGRAKLGSFPYKRQSSYEFEPETRLEGYRRRKARR